MSDATTLNGQLPSYYLHRENATGTQLASTISDFAAQVRATRLDQFASPTSSVSVNDQTIVNVADPVSATDAATKGYVDSAVSSLDLFSSCALTGTSTAPTASANTSTTQIATTAFVLNQAADSLPLEDSSAAIGNSKRYAKQDHVHPINETLARLASPTFTGTVTFNAAISLGASKGITIASGAPDTTTNALYQVDGKLFFGSAAVYAVGSANPTMNGSLAVGTSAAAAREDHVHPTDTTLAKLESPVFTGNPRGPTPTDNDDDTSLATTEYVKNQGYLITNETITVTGDATGSGTDAITLTLANTAVSPGTYKSVTVDHKGRVTGGTNPTTLDGYGITDAIGTDLLGASSGVATLDSNGYVPAAQLDLSSFANPGFSGAVTLNGTSGAQWINGVNSETITLSTSAAFTDSVTDLLPANAVIEAVVARVQTTIATATAWTIGDATTTGRFVATTSTLSSGTTAVGLVHVGVTGAGSARQTSAAKLRIATTGTPSAGVVKVEVFYKQFVAPTS